MKKKLPLLAAILVVFVALAVAGGTNEGKGPSDGNTPGMLRPYVLVGGVLYTVSPDGGNIVLDYEPAQSDWAGTLTAQVKGSEMPTQDGESNFCEAGSPYVFCEEGIAVRRGAGWYVYVPAGE